MFTVLTASYNEIWDQCKDAIPAPSPKKFPKAKLRNTGKYCKYHDDGGHNTNICIALKDMIESLLRDGKLSQYRPRQA